MQAGPLGNHGGGCERLTQKNIHNGNITLGEEGGFQNKTNYLERSYTEERREELREADAQGDVGDKSLF